MVLLCFSCDILAMSTYTCIRNWMMHYLLVEVQTPRLVVQHWFVLISSFYGSCLSTLEQTDYVKSCRKLSVAMAILLQWLQMRTHYNARDPLYISICMASNPLGGQQCLQNSVFCRRHRTCLQVQWWHQESNKRYRAD